MEYGRTGEKFCRKERMDILYIVIPAYNEEANIRDVIEDWYPVVEKYNGEGKSRLLIIDDGSKDSTYGIIKEYAKQRPLLEAVTKQNGGHGSTVLYGYHHALSKGADYIFQTDSDGQTVPEEFHDFWKQRKEYDMVIGYRKNREDGLSRVFVTKVLKAVIFCCFHVKLTDANTPFRLMNAETLQKHIGAVPKDFNLSNVLISVIYAKNNVNTQYVPITFRPRQGGKNSINLKSIAKIGKQAVKDFRNINKVLDSYKSK